MPKVATFFGGGLKDTESIEYNESVLIGNLLGEHEYMVKNGGYSGLMEAVSKGASENGSDVLGFTCRTYRSVIGNEYLTRTIPCDDIYERLRNLISSSNIFITHRGGIGTLSELSLVIDECRKMKNPPKIYIIGDIWKTIFESFKGKIMSEKEFGILTFCEDYKDFESKFIKDEQ